MKTYAETSDILKKIYFEIDQLSQNPKNIKDYSKFHKDGKVHIKITVPLTRKVASRNFKLVKHMSKKHILYLCTQLLQRKDDTYRLIAFDWAFKLKKYYKKDDFKIFEGWLKKHIDTWENCDDLCTHALGNFIYQFPEFIPQIENLTKSKNRWVRRGSAVMLIYSLRKGKYLKEALNIAKILSNDNDNLVQKGCGWMLKEASKLYQKEVFNFIMINKNVIPPITIRYSIEKMPKKLRSDILKG